MKTKEDKFEKLILLLNKLNPSADLGFIKKIAKSAKTENEFKELYELIKDFRHIATAEHRAVVNDLLVICEELGKSAKKNKKKKDSNKKQEESKETEKVEDVLKNDEDSVIGNDSVDTGSVDNDPATNDITIENLNEELNKYSE